MVLLMTLEPKDLPPLPDSWHSPRWDNIGRVHDWRNYIPDGLAARWDELSVEGRMIAACMAQEQANREEWD
jgi:hypothetical protein